MKNLQQTSFTGEPSLQNSLELAAKTLKMLPSHASKEILLIMGSLTTCDPGDIGETIQVCKLRLLKLYDFSYSNVLIFSHFLDFKN